MMIELDDGPRRIVEVEKAECQHLHCSNYDPAKVVPNQPVQVIGNGLMWCFDCKQFFRPQLPEPRYTLPQLSALAREYVEAARERWAEQDVVETELQLSSFLAWIQNLQKRDLR